ncbi:LacI family DNA-binding transcriptional regulator [Bifidobacterium cebidarum]|uniref:LacI family transcriptional regulator n=1 Tax=Bifidobacterium cebidarum TaxID=2650773 RepID=A0A6I1GCE1_9BIFI|nr:LacI family DNA-binding transcriptional regulator [Bifidobacterium cebidarum]KAB7789293.1 LacI family transcriptional regulator [Bifidobacterium cebidarum]
MTKDSNMKRITINDVAAEAHVSIKTVSNVINNAGSMRPETRKRVQDAIERLGYTVNYSARSLKTGTTKIIGLALMAFEQPWTSMYAGEIIKSARKRGYSVVIDTYGDDGLSSIIDETYCVNADGWIYYADRPLSRRGRLLQQRYPVVLTGESLSYGLVDSVTMPNLQPIYEIATALIRQGVQCIGLIGAPDDLVKEGRLDEIRDLKEGTRVLRTQGYYQAFADAGLSVNTDVVVEGGRWDVNWGVWGAKRLLDVPAFREASSRAVICLNDALALGSLHAFKEYGWHIPGDVQISGFDDIEEGRHSDPALTTVNSQLDRYADYAVDMLIERIAGDTQPVRAVSTDYVIEHRGSTTFAR